MQKTIRYRRGSSHMIKMKAALVACACALTLASAGAAEKVKIGVLTDMSSVYSDFGGMGTVEIVKLAIQDAGAKLGDDVEIVYADHQNKADIGAAIATKWFDEGVDVIVDVPNSSVAFAVSEIARNRNKVLLASGAGSSELTGSRCSPNTIQWTYDTYAISKSIGTALVREGGESWYFITADYAFGQALEKDTTAVVTSAGAKVLGSVRHPLNTSDFSSYLLQAQAAKPKVLGLANAGGDLRNSINQAREFGITRSGVRLAGLVVLVLDVHALGLEKAQGLQLAESFYWDLDDDTRALSRRFFDHVGRMPVMNQAGGYSATYNYLKAVQAVHSKEPAKVLAWLRSRPLSDPTLKNGRIREDGRMMRDYYVFSVKSPKESTKPWDYYKLVSTVKAEEAARPLKDGNCPLVAAK